MSADAERLTQDVADESRMWWVFLITGIAWIFFSLIVLSFEVRSLVAIGYWIGVLLIAAGATEFATLTTRRPWAWLHILLGIVFIIGGISAFFSPVQTFLILAALIGWFLLFRGVFDIVVALMNRDQELWWAFLIAGIVQVLVAFWATGYPGRSIALLLVWVGAAAMLRGIVQILFAFQLRGVR